MTDFELGVSSYLEKKYELAKLHFYNAIQQQPENYVAHHNLGVTLIQLGENESAIDFFALPCKNNYIESFISLGAALRNVGKYQEALTAFAYAFTIDKNHAVAYSNYSNTLREFGYPEIALDFIKIANRIKPDNTSLLNESVTYLTLENLTEGWKKYNYRWYYETGESLKPNLPGPEYDGSQDIKNKTILVYCEQGFGDCIQFIRYVNLLNKKDAKVILLCKPELSKLFQFSFPNIRVIDWGSEIPSYNFHAAMLDLPKCFNTNINTIPYTDAYLSIDEKIKNYWRNVLGQKTKLRIGVAWTSNNIAFTTKFRKINLIELANIFSTDYEFVNLQVGFSQEEKSILDRHNVRDFTNKFSDFYDSAGLISILDGVISVDTSTAHLAGALGIPTFVILSNYGCDWRWFQKRSDSPFYQSVKLFRKEGDSYTSVLNSIFTQLKYLG